MINKKLIKDVYSTSEVKTNKIFVDENNVEHNIYRKIIKGILPRTNYTKFIDMSSASEIITEDIRVTGNDGNVMKLPFVNLTNNVYLDYYVSSQNEYFIHFTASAYAGLSFKAIIEYTK